MRIPPDARRHATVGKQYQLARITPTINPLTVGTISSCLTVVHRINSYNPLSPPGIVGHADGHAVDYDRRRLSVCWGLEGSTSCIYFILFFFVKSAVYS